MCVTSLNWAYKINKGNLIVDHHDFSSPSSQGKPFSNCTWAFKALFKKVFQLKYLSGN